MIFTGNQIRDKFLKYFENKGHSHIASASLLPFNDPTLFFTNAGMVPFKDIFTGREKRDYTKATTSQKCMRVSGKHNDLENVGRTPRHHTFFEMLGNFSFGDYFKKDAIHYAWDFLTNIVGIPKEWLWITVFTDDDEAEQIWINQEKVAKERIIRLGEKENFWSMGETGPCGPCSEIHVDLKQLHGEGIAKGNPGNNENDFMEIWNLVFMQFNRDESGRQTPLPKPSIDTGMGLERLAAVLQKKKSNYETDLFFPLIQEIAHKTNKTYRADKTDDEISVSMRVLADHIRAAVFLISDGVQPSNEGRGYVLRRIMRRAIRHGKMLGQTEAFFFTLIPTLIKLMGEAYPDLIKNESFITKVIKTEEERFLETLDRGMEMINEELSLLEKDKNKVFSGEKAFTLYDTFGFPFDLTELIASEKGFTVDKEQFDAEMEKQKGRARAAWKGSGQDAVADLYHELSNAGISTRFLGYETLNAESIIKALIVNGAQVQEAKEGTPVYVITKDTPFYGESGGQVGDKGSIVSATAQVQIDDTAKPLDGLFVHQGKVLTGTLKVGDNVSLKVNEIHRRPVMLNHTATHILHAALREILGDHVKQAGSLVDPTRLRFDFSHFEALTREQIEKIECRVNEVIQKNYVVTKEEMTQDEAKKKGALAFFGDKYGDKVRVVTVGPYSMEFCGGTHLNASGEIGCFKITGESSVASGVRRIEAVTGMAAVKEFQNLKRILDNVASVLKAPASELVVRIQKNSEEAKKLQKEISQLKTKVATSGVATGGSTSGGSTDYLAQVKEINGVKVLALEISLDDPKAIRDLGDQLKNKIGSGLVVIGTRAEGKATLTVMVTKDLTSKYQAGKIVGALAQIIGGKGGGRPDMAQAGGSLPDKLPEALAAVETLL